MTGLAALVALVAAMPAAAQPCWSPAEADAAKVRELQSMLMVAALRCRSDGIDILADYDALIQAERPAFVDANASLHGHFGAQDEEDYDGFATMLANAYSDGGARPLGCNTAVGLMRDAAAAPDAAALLRVASASVAARDLPGGRCAAPAPRAVTLAPEVVAALETLARLQPRQVATAAPTATSMPAPMPAPMSFAPTQLASTAP